MADLDRPLRGGKRDDRSQGAVIATLRHSLRAINFIFAVIGLAIIGYGSYLYWEIKHEGKLQGYPWFIFAFLIVGIVTFLTASIALVGVAHNNRCLLGSYGFFVTVLLVAQAALAIAFFTDNSWKKHIPHDKTGEEKKMEKFLKSNLTVVRWVGLGVLIIEMISILIAYALSSAQQRLIRENSEDEDEVWGRRTSLSRAETGTAGPSGPSQERQDPWSQRMRSKYGLDTSVFTYDPIISNQGASPSPVAPPGQPKKRCKVM